MVLNFKIIYFSFFLDILLLSSQNEVKQTMSLKVKLFYVMLKTTVFCWHGVILLTK